MLAEEKLFRQEIEGKYQIYIEKYLPIFSTFAGNGWYYRLVVEDMKPSFIKKLLRMNVRKYFIGNEVDSSYVEGMDDIAECLSGEKTEKISHFFPKRIKIESVMPKDKKIDIYFTDIYNNGLKFENTKTFTI